jgi:hypothetical protein
MLKNLRDFENFHILLWLAKDVCWVTEFEIGGAIMVAPTLLLAMFITYKGRRDKADLFHNLAVVCWIAANSVWMLGEFYGEQMGYDDEVTKPHARILFFVGLSFVVYYYTIRLIQRKRA